ncbi:MAG: leucyl aminopeptidase [Geminicoccaceae bacterium]|nr:MAG: leucyl aminopeptidase [Geminicoccaceae bacterium]
MEIRFVTPEARGAGALAVVVGVDGGMGATARAIDEASGGLLRRALELAGLPLDRGQIVDVVVPAAAGWDRVLLWAVPTPEVLPVKDAVELGAGLATAALARKLERLTLLVEAAGDAVTLGLVEGTALRSYRFDQFKPAKTNGAKKLAALNVATPHAVALAAAWPAREAVVAGTHLARDLVNRPANSLDTDAFVAAAKELTSLGVEVTVLDRAAMAELGMGALLGVAQGSRMPPYTVLMHWRGAGDDRAPLALVGKGVVFDSGGLSLKPPKSMETMKCDMAGAATVVGALHALARRQAKANVVGAIGLVENMPSSTAQRPGDVVTSLAGKTIEVLNTDAEGRLVLADVLAHVKATQKPQAMIDFATLTGAIIVALGYEHAGLFANDDDLAAKLLDAGEATGETLWRMPLGKGYTKQLESPIADLKNIGKPGQAGASIGAAFLEAFVGDGPWAHVDLAATSFTESEHPVGGRGGTGWGVRLVDRLVQDAFEG